MANRKEDSCPLCKLEAQPISVSDGGERLDVECLRCGRFRITGTAAAVARKQNVATKLSAWIRERTLQGVDLPEIHSKSLDSITRNLPEYSVSQKQLLLLKAIAGMSSYPGATVSLASNTDFPLAWASGEEELGFYVRALDERHLIQHTDSPSRKAGDVIFNLRVTNQGWDYLDQYARASPVSDQGFVAMSFSDMMRPVWETAIRPAIVNAGYKPYRTDAEPHADRIDVKIMTEIQASRFVVADVTEHRQGVYFEAGYALGLKIPVIWTVRKDHLAQAHFDTRQYNHLAWESPEELREQLYFYVCAIIGKRGEA